MASDNTIFKLNKEENCPGWQETFDAAIDITAIISNEFEILKINKAGYTSLGKSSEDLVGKKCYQVVHGLESPIDGCACKKALESKSASESEIFDRGRYYLTTAAPIWNKDNQCYAFAHTVKDITEQKHAEKTLIEAKDLLEERVRERTADLTRTNNNLMHEIEERKKSEKALKESSKELQSQRIALEQKNIALSEIIAQIEVEKKIIKNDISTNIERIVIPTIEKLCLNGNSDLVIKILKKQLNDITIQYGSIVTNKTYKLTNREIELCNYIRNGLSSKEIANLLNLSLKTINKHRRNIRRKLDLTNSEINLTTYLGNLH